MDENMMEVMCPFSTFYIHVIYLTKHLCMKNDISFPVFSYAVIPTQVEFLFLFIPISDKLRLSLNSLSYMSFFARKRGIELTSVSLKFDGAIALYPDLTDIGELFSFQPTYKRRILYELEQTRSGFLIVDALDLERAQNEKWNLSGECHVSLSSSRLVTFFFPDHENIIRQTYSLPLDSIHQMVSSAYNHYMTPKLLPHKLLSNA
jgi:hypothetical protein